MESKEKRIKAEYERLKDICKDLPKNKRELADPAIQNLAFMKITLDDLQKEINSNGCSEEYKNGENQFGKKASANIQAYNALVKNYNTISDRIDKMLPPKEKEESFEQMMEKMLSDE